MAYSAILSVIVVFGLTKAVASYDAGARANCIGRKKLLVYGCIFKLPMPLLLASKGFSLTQIGTVTAMAPPYGACWAIS